MAPLSGQRPHCGGGRSNAEVALWASAMFHGTKPRRRQQATLFTSDGWKRPSSSTSSAVRGKLWLDQPTTSFNTYSLSFICINIMNLFILVVFNFGVDFMPQCKTMVCLKQRSFSCQWNPGNTHTGIPQNYQKHSIKLKEQLIRFSCCRSECVITVTSHPAHMDALFHGHLKGILIEPGTGILFKVKDEDCPWGQRSPWSN